MILFVGEKRSKTAIARGWTWFSGRLAAKTLYDALAFAGRKGKGDDFANLFEVDIYNGWAYVLLQCRRGVPLVALGQKVHKALELYGIRHITIRHPAARGAGRARRKYQIHVATMLRGIDG